MRGLKSTVLLLLVLVGLGAYIYFVETKRPAPSEIEAKPKVFSVEAGKIEALRVTDDKGETTVLEKREGAWHVSEPVQSAADENEASGITTNLSTLEVQRVVDEAPATLDPYGLAKPRIQVAFKAEGDKDFRQLLVGDKNATGSDLYAKLADQKRVLLIPGFLESTFNRSTFDLRDKSVLKFDRDKIDQVEIQSGGQQIKLAKSDAEWKMTAPLPVRADYSLVDGLIGRLNTTNMKSIVRQEVESPKTYGFDQPQATVTVAAGSARATLIVGSKADDTSVYARDLSRPSVFTLDSVLADDLRKPPADYRRKDIFEFRPFNATRLEIARGGQTVAFEKVKGTGENTQETWRQVAPSSADVDREKMDDLLSKVSNLRADSFTDSRANTGLDAPAATIVAKYDEGKKEERVTLGRSGTSAYAAMGGEPGAAVFKASDLDEALKALDAVKK